MRVSQGFESPEYYNRPDKWEFEFLSKVDPGKGPVKVRVTRMFRIRAIDYDSEKHETKEYLYYETEWHASQWNGNPLRLNEHVVGRQLLGDFGPDSINVTDKESVIYYGKFNRILGMESFSRLYL